MEWSGMKTAGWIAWVFAALFAIDLVAVLRPGTALLWLRQWMSWTNRFSRLVGVERRIVDETQCRTAIRIGGVLYFGLLLWLATFWWQGR